MKNSCLKASSLAIKLTGKSLNRYTKDNEPWYVLNAIKNLVASSTNGLADRGSLKRRIIKRMNADALNKAVEVLIQREDIIELSLPNRVRKNSKVTYYKLVKK